MITIKTVSLSLVLIVATATASFAQTAKLRIDTNVDSARVFLNGNETAFVTPARIEGLHAGPVNIRLEKGEYSVEGTAVVPDSGSAVLTLLFPLGDLFVMSDLEGATINLNGEPTFQAVPYSFTDLHAGNYTIELFQGGTVLKRKVRVVPNTENLAMLTIEEDEVSGNTLYLILGGVAAAGATAAILILGGSSEKPGINPPNPEDIFPQGQ